MEDLGANKEILAIVGFAASLGVPPETLLQAARLDPILAARALVSHGRVLRVWEAATRLSGDPDFGLHFAEWVIQQAEDRFDVLAFALRSCATLGEQYQRIGRYVRLIHKEAFLSLEVEGDTARLVHGLTHHGLSPRQPSEAMMASMFLQGRRSIGDDFVLREVCFVHPEPAHTTESARLFQSPVRYGSPRDALVFDRTFLGRSQRHAEPRLLAMLERQLDGLLSQIPVGNSVTAATRHYVAEALPGGEPTLLTVAARLHMSPRTLQRRLGDEGTNFVDLLADVRHAGALSHLQNPEIAIHEVAFLLGFSEVSAFYRAFKRRTGVTPAEYRRAGAAST